VYLPDQEVPPGGLGALAMNAHRGKTAFVTKESIVEFPEVLSDQTTDQLNELRAAAVAAFRALPIENPTEAQIVEGENIVAGIQRIDGEFARREELTARADALRAFQVEPEQASEESAETEGEQAQEAEGEGEGEQAEQQEAAATTTTTAPTFAQKASTVQVLATRTARPQAPEGQRGGLDIRVAPDVPGFSASSQLTGIEQMADALVARMSGFTPPNGDGQSEDLRHFGVATIRRSVPDELVIQRGDDEDVQLQKMKLASDEHRLPGKSLVASGGWCAPSEQLYDLCESETTEGILSLPTNTWARGGIKYTQGPDFASILGASGLGFRQTEAEAIAGTTKSCFEVPCPSFTEKRLDAVGLCVKAPILTNAAYPELVQRWLRGALVVHQRKVNASHISAMQTALGTSLVATDVGSTAQSTLAAIELTADYQRQVRAWSFNQTLEVVLPFWVRGAIRSDLAIRTGKQEAAITDQMIQDEFAARHVNVQWVYDLDALSADPVVYPATFHALMYPAGSFVVGTSDVIKLNAVYDAASLAGNIYTALFFEEGDAVVQLCPGGKQLTLPVCSAGATGGATISNCLNGA
jgi:hypothetical protein